MNIKYKIQCYECGWKAGTETIKDARKTRKAHLVVCSADTFLEGGTNIPIFRLSDGAMMQKEWALVPKMLGGTK
jgi:hypothetical protein